MTPDEIDQLAESVCKRLDTHRQEWWVEPEIHYNQHKEIAELLSNYKEAKGMFWKAFIGFAIIGSGVATLLGIGITHLGK